MRHANAVVLAEDTYQLDGVLSIFMDSVNEVFTPIPMSGYPNYRAWRPKKW
jgi:hypothetical protein